VLGLYVPVATVAAATVAASVVLTLEVRRVSEPGELLRGSARDPS
jgi:hypothetical protein